MKQILLFCLAICCVGAIHAQGEITFIEETVVVSDVAGGDFEGVGYNLIVNNSSAIRVLRWNIVVEEMTEGWQVAFCDKNLCYLPATTTETFAAVPDEENRMDVHVYPNGNEGSAIITIEVVDENDANVTTSHTYYFNTEPSSTTEVFEDAIKVYPNPTSGFFSLKNSENVSSIEVMSLTGQRVRSFTANQGRWYDLSELPRGTYLVRLLDRQEQILTTKLLNRS